MDVFVGRLINCVQKHKNVNTSHAQKKMTVVQTHTLQSLLA